MNCRVCGRSPDDTPMVFKTEQWCSENHRKIVQKEVKPSYEDWRLGFHDHRLLNSLWTYWEMDEDS